MSLLLMKPKDAVSTQPQRPEVPAIDHTLEDIPKATKCELQDTTCQRPSPHRAPICAGLGPRHHVKPPHSTPFSVNCSSEEKKRGGDRGRQE